LTQIGVAGSGDMNSRTPDSAAIDTGTNRLYITRTKPYREVAGIDVVDGTTGLRQEVAFPNSDGTSGVADQGSFGVAVNPVTHLVYVTNGATPGVVRVLK